MPLSKQIVSWPLTGGLDSKKSPLSIQPGSHLALDDVRQERVNEWRARNGYVSAGALDYPSSSLASLLARMPRGGRFAKLSGDMWSNTLGAIPAWQADASSGFISGGLGESEPQIAFGCWSRATMPAVGQDAFANASPANPSVAVGGGVILTACETSSTTISIVARRLDSNLPSDTALGSFTGTRPRCGFANGVLFVVFVNGGALYSYKVQNAVSPSRLVLTADLAGAISGLHATQPYIDTYTYGSSVNATVVVRTSGDTVRFVEYNPATGATPTNVIVAGVSCANCLCLLPDADGSGIRALGTSHTTPTTRVVRVNSAGAVQTDDQAEAIASTQMAGSLFTAGAEWIVYYKTATEVRAAKKAGTVGSAVAVVAVPEVTIHNNVWRESGSLRYSVLLGYHGPASDPQDTYWEASGDFIAGNNTVFLNEYVRRAQAHILPLEGCPAPTRNAIVQQAARNGAMDYFLPALRLVVINQSPTRTTTYVADLLRVQYLTRANRPNINAGNHSEIGDTIFVPVGGGFLFDDNSRHGRLGCVIVPGQPTLVEGAGGSLTLLGNYQYCAVEVLTWRNGKTWRSPPSIPQSITLTGANRSVLWTVNCHWLEGYDVRRTIEIYRNENNGSLFRCIGEQSVGQNDVIGPINDTLADTAIVSGKLLYSHGEVPTGITPRAAHCAWFGDRFWIASADFRRRLYFSKKVNGESMPEHNDAFVVELPDDAGDITQIQPMDDRLAVFTENSIYVITGDGPDTTGAGAFPSYVKISSEIGCVVGGKSVSTGDSVYFTSLRGIHRVWKSNEIDYVGEGVDVYFNQPQVQTPVVVLDAAFVEHLSEIRFVTSGFVLVYDREMGIWYRDIGGLASGATLVAGCYDGERFVLQRSNDTMYYEGGTSQTTDAGTAYNGKIRSAWIRPSGIVDQRLRIYMARLIMTRTLGGSNATPTLKIYYDNDDAIVETFTPSAAIPGATLLVRGSIQPRRHRCSTFSLEAVLPSSDVTMRLDAWAAEIGMKKGAFKNAAAERWV